MARRRRYSRKKGSRRKDKSIPLSMLLPVAPAAKRVMDVGINKDTPDWILFEMTGYSLTDKAFHTDVIKRQAGLAIVSLVSHKVANKIGLNRALKKATMGYFKW